MDHHFLLLGAAGNFLAPISTMSENAFKTVLEIDTVRGPSFWPDMRTHLNQMGSFNTIKATLPHLRASKGAYIHVSATLHYRGNRFSGVTTFFCRFSKNLWPATPFQVHVSAAKAGVDALSAVLAVEEGPNGVRSNVIAPGPIKDTEGMDRLSVQTDSSHSNFPAGRMGRMSDIGNATVFLFSDAAAFITGQALAVDGGTMHFPFSKLPYPMSVINPESVAHMIKPKMWSIPPKSWQFNNRYIDYHVESKRMTDFWAKGNPLTQFYWWLNPLVLTNGEAKRLLQTFTIRTLSHEYI